MICISDESPSANHVSSKPFKHTAGRWLCQPGVHTAFTQGFPQLSGAECLRCGLRLGLNSWLKLPQGEPFERRQQHATFETGRKTQKKRQTAGTHRVESQKTCQKTNLESLLKEPFGNSIPESLLSQIQAPWPELIEGVCLLTHLMPDARREMHKSAQQATHLLSIHCLYTRLGASARGWEKK